MQFTAWQKRHRHVCVAAAIYSAHLKLHPLMVLSVLVIAEHSLGVWGLLLAGACFGYTPPLVICPDPMLSGEFAPAAWQCLQLQGAVQSGKHTLASI